MTLSVQYPYATSGALANSTSISGSLTRQLTVLLRRVAMLLLFGGAIPAQTHQQGPDLIDREHVIDPSARERRARCDGALGGARILDHGDPAGAPHGGQPVGAVVARA